MYKKEYESVQLMSFLEKETEDGGYCPVCGDYYYIPACTEMVAGKVFNCLNCSCIVAKIIAIKVIEKEIIK